MDRSEGESPGGGRSPPGFARDGGKLRRDVSNANMTAPEAVTSAEALLQNPRSGSWGEAEVFHVV